MQKLFIKQKLFFRPIAGVNEPADRQIRDVSVTDVRFLNQASCFETLRVYQGTAYKLKSHLKRLADSFRAIVPGLAMWPTQEEISFFIQEAINQSGYGASSILRVTVFAEAITNTETAPRFVLFIRPGSPIVPEHRLRQVACAGFVSGRKPSPASVNHLVKGSDYVNAILALWDKSDQFMDEKFFLNSEGYVSEGLVSNIFIVSRKRVLTPPLASGILEGVCRADVMRLANELGYPTLETYFTRHDVYTAQECFITNSSIEILPIVSVDGRDVGDARPGPVTQKIHQLYRQNVSKECQYAYTDSID